jgi:hypothetical protein
MVLGVDGCWHGYGVGSHELVWMNVGKDIELGVDGCRHGYGVGATSWCGWKSDRLWCWELMDVGKVIMLGVDGCRQGDHVGS